MASWCSERAWSSLRAQMFSTVSQPWRAALPKQVPEALTLTEAVLSCHISVFFFLTFWRAMLGVVREGRKVESLE